MRSWLGYVGGLLFSLVVAFIIAPLFPEPLSEVIYWVALVVAALCVLALLAWLFWWRPRGPHEPV
jgi:CDP-diglyceride synthetase